MPASDRVEAREQASDAALAGELVDGRYRVLRRLGRGGMGEVLRALDLGNGREIALKRFRLDLDKSDDLLRFRREFHTLARLRHPTIVEAYDFGLDRGRPYYTMELLDGRDFGDLAPAPWREACELLRDIASALAFLHARRLLHRDVTPRNARCTEDGPAKLLDFGMLATVGVSSEIVGTVHSIAPEMMLGLPMDARADLFGLGALAFWLLTGRHPRRARTIHDLIREGKLRPPRPSSLAAGVPEALDELVLSLLSPEPLGRPSSAAEVIDRLGAIASLPAAPELEAARGYVRSVDLVGRKHEMELARKRLARAIDGSGSAIVIEGRSGMGKTRLLHEIELEAKLAGAAVLRGQGQSGGGPYALLHAMGVDRARDAAGDVEVSVIGRLLREEAVGATEPDGPTMVGRIEDLERGVDPREDRLQLQAALGERIAALSDDRPLVVLVDELQRVDEGSASVLAAMAYGARARRVLLVCTLRTDEPAAAGRAIDKIRERAVVLPARGLDVDEIEQLVRGTFGEVPHVARLADWLRRVAGGSPLHCIEVVRYLVDAAVVRYVDGVWVMPDRFELEGVPRGLTETMDARVAGLSQRARSLGQVLAVTGGEVPLRRMVTLAAPLGEDEVFAALDELVREDVLVGDRDRFEIRHDGLAEALLRSLDEDRRRALELHVGRTLATLEPDGDHQAVDEAQIGWHLLRGGERHTGARLLARAGRRLFEATSFADAIAPLEAALAVYEERGDNPRRVLQLLDMLHTAGFFSDRDVAVRYRDRTHDLLARYAGVTLAARLRRFVGRTLALVLGVAVANVRHALASASTRGPRPIEAIRLYLRSVVYAAGVAGFSFDTHTLRACLERLESFTTVRLPAVVNAIRFVENLLSFNLGRLTRVREVTPMELDALEREAAAFSEGERRLALGGALFQRALAHVRSGSPDALPTIAELDRLDMRIWALGAMQLRHHHHMWRGEEDSARRVWARAELEFVRLGSLWQLEAVHHSSACVTHAFIGDALGLKRSIEGLARQVAAGMGYEGHLAVAQAEHARMRGDIAGARANLDRAFASLPEGEGLVRPWALAARADLAFDAGELAQARRDAEVALRASTDPEHGQEAFRFRAGRTLALVESACGERDAASERLDSLLAAATPADNPFVMGALHEARVLVALAAGDQVAVAQHAGAAERAFRATRNPILVARWERLERAIHPPPDPDTADAGVDAVTELVDGPNHNDTVAEALELLSDCRTAQARAERALAILEKVCGASEAFLWLFRGGRLELAASSRATEPSAALVESVFARVEAAHDDGDDLPTTLAAVRPASDRTWMSIVLACPRERTVAIAGAAALRGGDDPLEPPPPSLVEAIAERFLDESVIAGADAARR